VAKWKGEFSATLFCPGLPGVGKTMIAATAIDSLLHSEYPNSLGIAYLYCNYKEEQDMSHMLAALLKQLLRPSTQLVEQLQKRRTKCNVRLSLDEVSSYLHDVLDKLATTHIVIDALDECQDGTRRQFLAKLRDLRAGRDVRLMVTSRFILEVEEDFLDALQLEIQASEADVRRFVAGQMHHLPRCVQRSPELRALLLNRIAEVADGMYVFIPSTR
jgi:hypothetical protein